MGHILDTGIRCSRAIKSGNMYLQLPNEGKSAKLRPCCQNLEKHLYFLEKHFFDHNDGGTIQRFLPGAVQQLKLLPIVSQPSKCLKL